MTHHTSLAVKIHQFMCISTNAHIPLQENGNAVLTLHGHAVVDACHIAVCFFSRAANLHNVTCQITGRCFFQVCNNAAMKTHSVNQPLYPEIPNHVGT